jgi:hypothetical protein
LLGDWCEAPVPILMHEGLRGRARPGRVRTVGFRESA